LHTLLWHASSKVQETSFWHHLKQRHHMSSIKHYLMQPHDKDGIT
jgi:hypothetical protein